MNLTEYKIENISDQIRGVSYKKSDISNKPLKDYIPLLKANNILENFELDLSNLIYVHKSKVNPKQVLRKGDIIIVASSGSIKIVGKGALYEKNTEATFGAFCKVIRPKSEKVNSKLISFFFQTHNYRQTISNLARGANINNLTNRHLDNLLVNIPESPMTQQQIVAVLDKAQALIKKREQSVALLDELLRATFLDMFGDPVTNEKSWEEKPISKVILKIDAGWSPKCESTPRNKTSEWAILKQSAISKRIFNPNENKLLPAATKIKKEVTANKGNLLFSRKNSSQFVGATVYLYDDYEKLLLPDTIFNLRYNPKIVSGIYLNFLFNDPNFRLVIQNLKSGSASSMPNISQKKLLELKIPLPPFKIQNEFSIIALKIRKHKETILQANNELNSLFQSLLQDAFKGALELQADEIAVTEAIEDVKWLQEQVLEISPTSQINKVIQNIQKITEPSQAFKNIAQIQEKLGTFNIPALDAIRGLQKSLNSLQIPHLKDIQNLQQFNAINKLTVLQQLTGTTNFSIKGLEKLQALEIQKQQEEELRQENDPILQFIYQEQLGKATINHYEVNIPKAIYTYFGKREFTLSQVIAALKENEGITGIKTVQLKKDLFSIFRKFITVSFGELFSFEQMRQKMKSTLFNPSFTLLEEFISAEFKNKTLEQVYINNWEAFSKYNTNWESSTIENETFASVNRIYLHLKPLADED